MTVLLRRLGSDEDAAGQIATPAMIDHSTTLERAFQLADSGEFAWPSEVRNRLAKEGFDDHRGELHGTRVLLQLLRRCAAARESRPAS